MTLPDELVKATRELALKRLHDRQCGCGQDDVQYVLADETDFGLIVECAVAAVLQELSVDEMSNVAAKTALFVFDDDERPTQDVLASVIADAIAEWLDVAIAKLADDE